MAGSDNESDEANIYNEATNTQQQPNIQPQIITNVSNNNAKFPYLKKDEYEDYYSSPKHSEEHIVVQRESKARTTLLQSIPDDHVADFHYMDDARDIWNAIKARFGGNAESKKMRKSMLKQEFSEFRIGEAEGLHKGYDMMQKILSQLNQLKAKPEDEDINLKFLRALPSSWSQVALTIKTKGGLELLSFDDLYYKLKTLEVDVKGYTTFSSSQYGPIHSAFVSATSASKKISYRDSTSYSSSTTYSAPSKSKTGSHRSDFEQIEQLDLEEMDLKWQMAMLSVRVHKFEQKAGRKINFDKKESTRFNKKKVICYKCQQRGHFARECRAKGGNDKQRYSSFNIKEIRKKEEDSKAFITVDTLVDWTYHDGESDGVIASKEFSMIAGCDTEEAIKEGATKIYNLITGADTKEASIAGDAGEFALMGVTSEVHNCPFGCDNKYNELHKQCDELNEQNGWDDSTFSVFITNSEDVDGKPLFYRFTKADSMKVVPRHLSRDYTSLSDHIDLDESQMSYGTKSSTSSDFKSVSMTLSLVMIVTSLQRSTQMTLPLVILVLNLQSPSQMIIPYVHQLLVIGKVNIPPARPQPVPTGKPKVFTPVLTCWPNRPCPVPTDRGYSPSVSSDWWKSTTRPMPHFSRPTSSYFQTYTPYAPTMSYTHMKYGGSIWATTVKPSAGCSWKSHRKGKSFSAVEDEGIFDSGCSRSMTGKQHKASYKAINVVSSIYEPLQLLHMDLFGPTSIRSIDHKYYSLVITDDYSSHFKPFGCHVTILNTSDHLGKFYGKADEGYIVGYSASNKAYRVYNVPNKRVEKTKNMRFLEAKPNVQGLGAVTNPVGTQGADSNFNCDEQVIIVPSYPSQSILRFEPKDTSGDEVDDSPLHSADENFQIELARLKVPPGCIPVLGNVPVPPGSLPVPTRSILFPTGNTVVSTDNVPVHTSSSTDSFFDDEPTRFPNPSDLGNHDPSPGIFSSSSYDNEFGAALNNVASTVEVIPVETTRINTIHPQSLIIGDPTSAVQTRSKGIVVRNKARLVAQGHRKEEGIDYDEVFAPVAKIEAIRLFLAFASYMGFMVYQMDVKSAFLYGRIDEEAWCDNFEALMNGEFQMSAIGELTFFLAQNLNPNSTSSMAALRYKDEHNKVGYLIKPIGSDDYHQIINFLRASHIRSPDLGPPAIQATIDKTPYTITEDLDQFGSPIVVDLICLSDGRRFNWSSYIFKGMVSNTRNAKKFFMHPRFLQAILGIETRIKRYYKVLMFSSKLCANMWLNFEGHPLPLLPAMLLQAQVGKGTEVAAQAVPQHMPTPDQPQDHLSTPPRKQTSDNHAPVLEHGQRSTQAPPTGQPSGCTEDPITLTILSFVVSTLVQKVNSLETELKDHKKLFKDVVGKLVKKVKAMKVKLKTKKRKMVVSDSDQEEGGKQDVDLDALHALANAAVTVDSNISPGGASNNPAASISVPTVVPTDASTIPPGASTIPPGTSTIPTGSTSVPDDVPPSVAPAGVSNKGKAPMMDEDSLVKARTFKQIEKDRLGEEAAKRLHDEEQAQLDRQRAVLQRRRQQEVFDSAMYYTKADWINIRAQVEANASLSKTLLGDNVPEDNFLARMAALIKRKRQALAKKLA
uniref:CCHC-type domain-containing protein n=1 Tax=Tanacetum cinerariifolium TaxID=118510 RepID=A0A6L2JXI1_TANCI|nr:hypothetical protein [Tanacetum cinerariifolium]